MPLTPHDDRRKPELRDHYCPTTAIYHICHPVTRIPWSRHIIYTSSSDNIGNHIWQCALPAEVLRARPTSNAPAKAQIWSFYPFSKRTTDLRLLSKIIDLRNGVWGVRTYPPVRMWYYHYLNHVPTFGATKKNQKNSKKLKITFISLRCFSELIHFYFAKLFSKKLSSRGYPRPVPAGAVCA